MEGCVPHGPGGLRSGPVWTKIGEASSSIQQIPEDWEGLEITFTGDHNKVSSMEDSSGNQMLMVSRNNEFHDIALMSTEHTAPVTFAKEGGGWEVGIEFAQPWSGEGWGLVWNPGDVEKAMISPVGNRMYAVSRVHAYEAREWALQMGHEIGDEYTGIGPPPYRAADWGGGSKDTVIDKISYAYQYTGPECLLYRKEWSHFPDCKFYVQGPNKTIFASGNPRNPLAVYISEPASHTQPIVDAPYSTEGIASIPDRGQWGPLAAQDVEPGMQFPTGTSGPQVFPGLYNSNNQHAHKGGGILNDTDANLGAGNPDVDFGLQTGGMSVVRILGSNASKITALSTRGNLVIVHTDKGCHIIYAPTADQAETGYRAEQATASTTSAAVNPLVVAGDGGTQPFWLGHDGQIYKDEAGARGAEDFKGYADPQQASWKSKGRWEQEHPNNLSNSFATYDPQSGMYWVFIERVESALAQRVPLYGPISLNVPPAPLYGPTNLDASFGTNLTLGPSGLTAVTNPVLGPISITAIVTPALGPIGLTAITNPALGPIGMIHVQAAPVQGPASLTAITNPALGPGSLTATVGSGVSGLQGWGVTDLNVILNGTTSGIGTNNYVASPTSIGLSGVADAQGGYYNTYFLMSDGSLRGVGYNNYGQLGLGDTANRTSDTQIVASGVSSILPTNRSLFFKKTNGTLWAAGQNIYGQLADGSTTNRSTPVEIVPTSLGWTISNYSSSGYHTLVVKSDGSLWGSGYNAVGSLGLGDYTNRNSWTQLISSGVASAVANYISTYVVKTDGTLWVTGENGYGELGLGTTSSVNTFTQVSGVAVSEVFQNSHGSQTFFKKTNGSVWGMGSNYYGNLGQGNNSQQNSPVEVISSGCDSVSSATTFAVFLMSDGSVKAAGTNTYGYFGTGNTTDSYSLVTSLASGISSLDTAVNHVIAY